MISAALLIASLTAHELAHALLARRRGVAVEGIKLWLFGGVAQMSGDWHERQDRDARRRDRAGGDRRARALFVGASWLLDQTGAPPLVILVAEWLAAVNILLLVFNLIPAFPLDGGRILRGFIWSRTKNRMTATVAAARSRSLLRGASSSASASSTSSSSSRWAGSG